MSNNSKLIKRSLTRSKSPSVPGRYNLNVILDIDETFVYFIKNTLMNDSWETIPEENESKYEIHKTKSGIFVIRPYIREFLDFLFTNCTVSLWTWSDEEYAMGVADIIENMVGKRPKYILFDEHAEASAGPLGKMGTKAYGNSKDLNMLWYGSEEQEIAPLKGFHECNTILIDDLPSNSVNNSNYRNSITIAPFALFGEVKDRSDPYKSLIDDDCLLQVIELLQHILPKLDERCKVNKDSECAHEVNIFSKENIEFYGIQKYVKKVRMDTYEKVNGRKRSIGFKLREAIAVGKSHLIHESHEGGARKTRRNRRRKVNRTQRRRRL